MNWRMKELSNRSILSFSDAHSPANMAREATIFQLQEPSYENVRKAIMFPVIASEAKQSQMEKIATSHSVPSVQAPAPRNDNRIIYTIEFYPEEGKYHFSGHRDCKISFSPQEVSEKGTQCPVCKKEFTEGVAVRIEQLGGKDFVDEYEQKLSPSGVKWHTDRSKNHPPYVKLVRLEQIIAESMGSTVASIKVKEMFGKICLELGPELQILLKTPVGEIRGIVGDKIAEGIERVRKGAIEVEPGYDGEYGRVKIFGEKASEKEKPDSAKASSGKKEQLGLF
jgi:PHP family Zn ribbon phosphoesterase